MAKYSSILLFPIAGLMVLPALAAFVREKGWEAAWRPVRVYALTAAAATLCSVNAGYLLRDTGQSLREYPFRTAGFQRLAELPLLGAIPLPLPSPFLDGIDLSNYHEQTGLNAGNIYLLGELRSLDDPTFRPFYSYFAVTYLFKEPLAMQILFLVALVLLCRAARREEWTKGVWEGWYLLVPVATYGAYFSFLYRTQLGLRYLLLMFPLSIIVTSRLALGWGKLSRARKLAIAAAVGYMAVSVASYYPHMIPYTNELVREKKDAWKLFADSNLSWLQDYWEVDRFLRAHPETILNPSRPVAGKIVVDANMLTGIVKETEFSWLRENFEPVSHVGYGHLLFEIPAEELSRKLPLESAPR